MSENPRIAVVVPCYNDGAFIEETVASIDEAEPIELVVVNDCSTDPATLEVLARMEANGVRVVHQPQNEGLGAARNAGLAATSAPFLYPLDSDDVAVPGVLGAMADRLEQHPDAVVAYGDYDEFGDHELLREVPATVDPYRLAYRNEYAPTALFRRAFLEEVGGWDPFRHERTYYEDWDLWMTVAERGARGLYMGRGFVTYRQRVHGFRLLEAVRQNHAVVYRRLKTQHPRLFADVGRHRRESSLSAKGRLLYPVVFGGRRRFAFEPKAKDVFERLTGRGSGRRKERAPAGGSVPR